MGARHQVQGKELGSSRAIPHAPPGVGLQLGLMASSGHDLPDWAVMAQGSSGWSRRVTHKWSSPPWTQNWPKALQRALATWATRRRSRWPSSWRASHTAPLPVGTWDKRQASGTGMRLEGPGQCTKPGAGLGSPPRPGLPKCDGVTTGCLLRVNMPKGLAQSLAPRQTPWKHKPARELRAGQPRGGEKGRGEPAVPTNSYTSQILSKNSSYEPSRKHTCKLSHNVQKV